MPNHRKPSLDEVGAMVMAFCALSDKMESYALVLADMFLIATGSDPSPEMGAFFAEKTEEMFAGVDEQTKADRLNEFVQASLAFFLVDLGPNGRNILKPRVEEEPSPAPPSRLWKN